MNTRPAFRGIRSQLGLSLTEAARRADISRRQLQRIEAGESSPSVRVAQRLRDVVAAEAGCRYTIDELFLAPPASTSSAAGAKSVD